MSQTRDVYDYLDAIRKRPDMFFSEDEDRLTSIEILLHGYYAALSFHNIIEGVPELNRSNFADWLYRKTGIGGALGWAHIINELHSDPQDAFDSFFEYLEEYRHQDVQET